MMRSYTATNVVFRCPGRQMAAKLYLLLAIILPSTLVPTLARAGTNSTGFPPGSYLKVTPWCDKVVCPTTAFTPHSSIELRARVIVPHGLPPGVQLACTPVWSLEGGLRYEEEPVRIVANHVIFTSDLGDSRIGGHCIEDPNVTTQKNAPLTLHTSTAPDAITTGTEFTKSLEATRTAQIPPPAQPPAPSASGSNASSNALLIGGLIAGAAALAVAAGAAAKSSSSGQACSGVFINNLTG